MYNKTDIKYLCEIAYTCGDRDILLSFDGNTVKDMFKFYEFIYEAWNTLSSDEYYFTEWLYSQNLRKMIKKYEKERL